MSFGVSLSLPPLTLSPFLTLLSLSLEYVTAGELPCVEVTAQYASRSINTACRQALALQQVFDFFYYID